MRALSCDVCKQKFTNPLPGRNCFHVAHRDICEPCYDQLHDKLRTVIRNKEPFNYAWYNHLIKDSIETGIQKGKF